MTIIGPTFFQYTVHPYPTASPTLTGEPPDGGTDGTDGGGGGAGGSVVMRLVLSTKWR
jgi:hypothetical protein